MSTFLIIQCKDTLSIEAKQQTNKKIRQIEKKGYQTIRYNKNKQAERVTYRKITEKVFYITKQQFINIKKTPV